MTGPTSRAEFFRREAGDYLKELEPLLGGAAPPLDSLIRLARGLRGAALLAGPASFARAAAALEQVAKLVRDGRLGWTEASPRLRRAIGAFQRLAAAAPSWDDRLDRDASSLAQDLQELGGGRPAPTSPTLPGNAAARNYVARESAVIAGVLERTTQRAAQEGGLTEGQLLEVRRAMQALRGLEALSDFPPLAELLDAVDSAASDLVHTPAPPDVGLGLLREAGGTIGLLARAVAGGEHTDPNLPEAERLADALFNQLGGERGVVPVDRLLTRDAPAVRLGGPEELPPADPSTLAGLGNALRQAGATLGAAPSPVTRRLRTFGLVVLLRTAPGGLGHRPAGSFLSRLLHALETRPELRESDRLVALLEQAGQALSDGAREDPLALARRLDAMTSELPATEQATAAPEPDAGPSRTGTALERSFSTYARLIREAEPILPIGALAYDEAERAVPIQSLMADPLPIVDIDTLLAADQHPVVDIRTLLAEPDQLEPAGAGEPETIIPIERLLYQPTVIPIDSLLYQGRAALERAGQIRSQLLSALRDREPDFRQLEPLVRELLDLVPLALADRA